MHSTGPAVPAALPCAPGAGGPHAVCSPAGALQQGEACGCWCSAWCKDCSAALAPVRPAGLLRSLLMLSLAKPCYVLPEAAAAPQPVAGMNSADSSTFAYSLQALRVAQAQSTLACATAGLRSQLDVGSAGAWRLMFRPCQTGSWQCHQQCQQHC